MKSSMLKLGAIAMAGTMIFGLAACKVDDPDNGPNGPGNATGLTSVYEIADYLARGADAHYITHTAAVGSANDDIACAAYYNALEGGTEGYANNYEFAAFIGMANRMYDVSEGENKTYYKNLLNSYIAGLDHYDGKGPITSTHGTREWDHIYGVHRSDYKFQASMVGEDMVYDDLMWIARYLIEGYEYSGRTETQYLKTAEYLVKCCLDGWDSTKGGAGGITWGPAYQTKHACSNGPILSVLGGLAEIYKDKDDVVTEEDTVFVKQTFGFDKVAWKNWVGAKKYDYYLTWLQDIYDWCWTNLRASDYTFIDLRGYNESDQRTEEHDEKAPGGAFWQFHGQLNSGNQTKYTYNTGSIISGAAWLYRLTENEQYLQQGRLMAEGAYHRFVKTVKTSDGTEHQLYECSSSLLFNSVLLQGYAELADAVKAAQNLEAEEKAEIFNNELNVYVGVFKSSILYGFENHVLNRTLPQNYIQGWLYGNNTADTHKDSKDAAATPEMLAIIVQYERAHGEI